MNARPRHARDSAGSARAVVDRHEASVDPQRRRADGVHYTPADLAAQLASVALDAAEASLERAVTSVCDPACGAGAILVATADELLRRGAAPERIATRILSGMDLDPGAARAARESVARWAADHGAHVAPDQVRIAVGDALQQDPGSWPWRPDEGFDVVIGNPPFQSQLASATARDEHQRELVRDRFGATGAYADSAALHLAGSVELCAQGGIVTMLQPVSVLGARDTAELRRWILDRSALLDLWTSDDQHFAAAVLVCAATLRVGQLRPATVTVRRDGAAGVQVPAPQGSDAWSSLAARAAGVPAVPESQGATLGSIATATAGFRDEFYALSAAIVDPSRTVADSAPLISTGMIDPLWSRWSHAPHRIAGEQRSAPVIDLAALDEHHASVGRWARRRMVPKVLVATQTKVIEAVVDEEGSAVPLTPVLSVEPLAGTDLWDLVVAVMAPPNVARLALVQWGSGRSAGSLRVPARRVLELPLPVDRALWRAAAELAARSHSSSAEPPALDRVAAVGELMTRAHGLDGDHPVQAWWEQRLPRR